MLSEIRPHDRLAYKVVHLVPEGTSSFCQGYHYYDCTDGAWVK